jgi:Domain of unknown function (DUF4386)
VDDSRWERWSALGGIVFVVLVLVSAFMPGSPPKTSDPTSKIVDFVHDHGGAIRWAGTVGALATIALFWFLGAVWRVLRRAEGGSPRLTVVAVIGAVFASVMAAVGGITLSVMGIVGPKGAGGSANIRVLYILSTNLGIGTVVGIAVFLIAFGIVIVRTGVFPRWLGWLGFVVALVAVAATGAISSTRDVFFDLGFAAFLGFLLWLLIVSVMMLTGRGSEPASSTA